MIVMMIIIIYIVLQYVYKHHSKALHNEATAKIKTACINAKGNSQIKVSQQHQQQK